MAYTGKDIIDYSAPQIVEKVIGKAQEDGSYRRQNIGANGQPKPRSKVWGNFGYVDPKTGEVIGTPLGIALDTMEPGDTSGSNPEVVAIKKKRNKFLATLQQISTQVAPGTRLRLSNIVFEIYRVKEDAETVEDAEEEVDLMDLLTAPMKEAAE